MAFILGHMKTNCSYFNRKSEQILRLFSNLCFVFIFLLPFISQAQSTVPGLREYLVSGNYEAVLEEGKNLLASNPGDIDKAYVYQLIADAHYYTNDINRSLENYLLAIASFAKNNESPLQHVMECHSHAGFCYRELGQHDKAIQYYQLALTYSTQLNDSSEIAVQYANLGTVYGRIGELQKASEYFNDAYAIDFIRRDTVALGFDLRNLAELQLLSGDYLLAIDYYKQSLKILENSTGNHNSHALRLGAIGNSFLRANQFDSARHYLTASLNELNNMGDSLNVAVQWIRLADLEFSSGNNKRALSWAKKAESYFTRLDESQYLINTNDILSKIYLSSGQPNPSLAYANKNIMLAQKQNLLVELRNAYMQAAMAYEAKGSTAEALTNFKQFKLLSDSMVNVNTNRSIAELQIQYDVDRIEQTNAILELENKIAKTDSYQKAMQLKWLLALLVIIVIAAVTISLTLTSRQKLKQALLVKEVTELRNQIRGILEGDPSKLKIQKESINNSLLTPLSDREFEILSYAISDLTNSEIANKVHVSANTVKFHLKNIYEKFGVGNRKEALKYAMSTAKG